MTRVLLAAALLLGAGSAIASAQKPGAMTKLRPEVRADLLAGSITAVQGGIGINVPAGMYARTELVAAGGTRLDGDGGASARADALMRFVFDPYEERRWGLSAGGGVSLRYDEGAGWRPFLAMVVDLELPSRAAMVPAVQFGLGGGARVGVVLRRREAGRR